MTMMSFRPSQKATTRRNPHKQQLQPPHTSWTHAGGDFGTTMAANVIIITKSHKGNRMWRRNANKANPFGKKPPKRTVITSQSTTSIWRWLLTYRWPLFLHDRSNGTSCRLIHWWWFIHPSICCRLKVDCRKVFRCFVGLTGLTDFRCTVWKVEYFFQPCSMIPLWYYDTNDTNDTKNKK